MPDSRRNSAIVTRAPGDCLIVSARIDLSAHLVAVGRKYRERRVYENATAIVRLPDYASSETWDFWVHEPGSRQRLAAFSIDPRAEIRHEINGGLLIVRALRGRNGGLSLRSFRLKEHFEIIDVSIEGQRLLIEGELMTEEEQLAGSVILEQVPVATGRSHEIPCEAHHSTSTGENYPLIISVELEELRILGAKSRTVYQPYVLNADERRISMGVARDANNFSALNRETSCRVMDPLYPDLVDEVPMPQAQVGAFFTKQGELRIAVKRIPS